MEVETFLVASAIDCVVAQRLARKLCEKCKQPYTPDRAELVEAGYPESQISDVARALSARSGASRARTPGTAAASVCTK